MRRLQGSLCMMGRLGLLREMSISIGHSLLSHKHGLPDCHHSILSSPLRTKRTRAASALLSRGYIPSKIPILTQTPNTETTFIKMPSQTRNYAASTLSGSTTYSYDKVPKENHTTKRSLRQRVKDAVKDIGTSPFEYDDEKERQAFTWVVTLPPSRT